MTDFEWHTVVAAAGAGGRGSPAMPAVDMSDPIIVLLAPLRCRLLWQQRVVPGTSPAAACVAPSCAGRRWRVPAPRRHTRPGNPGATAIPAVQLCTHCLRLFRGPAFMPLGLECVTLNGCWMQGRRGLHVMRRRSGAITPFSCAGTRARNRTPPRVGFRALLTWRVSTAGMLAARPTHPMSTTNQCATPPPFSPCLGHTHHARAAAAVADFPAAMAAVLATAHPPCSPVTQMPRQTRWRACRAGLPGSATCHCCVPRRLCMPRQRWLACTLQDRGSMLCACAPLASCLLRTTPPASMPPPTLCDLPARQHPVTRSSVQAPP
jgi:hypothetical protein